MRWNNGARQSERSPQTRTFQYPTAYSVNTGKDLVSQHNTPSFKMVCTSPTCK